MAVHAGATLQDRIRLTAVAPTGVVPEKESPPFLFEGRELKQKRTFGNDML
jgi:hypothetical protein